jgi:hypothetical protein
MCVRERAIFGTTRVLRSTRMRRLFKPKPPVRAVMFVSPGALRYSPMTTLVYRSAPAHPSAKE